MANKKVETKKVETKKETVKEPKVPKEPTLAEVKKELADAKVKLEGVKHAFEQGVSPESIINIIKKVLDN